jgi:hypothetical protein
MNNIELLKNSSVRGDIADAVAYIKPDINLSVFLLSKASS